MSRYNYRHADLVLLTGSTRAIGELCMDINNAGEALTVLAEAVDVPPPLRRYYAKVGKKLTVTGSRLKQSMDSAEHDGLKLAMRINSSIGQLKLNEEDMAHLHQVNNRLLELEKSLKLMADGMRERLEGLDPPNVLWDVWDGTNIILWLSIGADPERPAYDPDAWAETGLMEPLEIRVKICAGRERKTAADQKLWGLDDAQNHGDLSGCEGHPLQHFPQGYLFHELFDHTDVGVWGMLHLKSLWIEIIPHRSGNFHI